MADRSHRIIPYRKGDRFYNQPDESYKSVVVPSLAMYIAGWHARRAGLPALQAWNVYEADLARTAYTLHAQTPSITWLGHASFLIVYPDITILVDPVFEDLTLMFPRLQQDGMKREQLPHIDAVLISHNHRDHMEQATLVYLAKTYGSTFYVPLGDARWLHAWGIEPVIESNWWDYHTIRSSKNAETSITISFLPAVHWSQRSLFDFNESLWGSWMIDYQGHRLYVAGDTSYGSHFSAIKKEFGTIDAALLPIGPCEPSRWMRGSHISAEEAGQAFIDLDAQLFIPMHWGTYGFGAEHPLLPLRRVEQWWRDAHEQLRDDKKLCTLRIGQSLG